MQSPISTNVNESAGGGGSRAAHDKTAEPHKLIGFRFASAILWLALPTAGFGQTFVGISANPTYGIAPLTVQFTAASADWDGHALTNWNWDFGDGSTSTSRNPAHTYRTAGTFVPGLIATNNLGGTAVSWPDTNSWIAVWLPTVQFTANPTVGAVPFIVQFTCTNRDSAGNAIARWNWTFGDGVSSTAQNPLHTYSTAGNFQPGLIVTNSRGTQISASGPTVAAAAYSGLVLNGGFETGDFFGWTLNADGGLYDLVDTFYQSTEGMQPHAPSSCFARLGQMYKLGYLSQTLATTPGGKYLLSFWLNSPDGLTFNEFQVSWEGNTLFSAINLPRTGPDPATSWTNLQFAVTATAGSTVLEFGFRDDPTALGLDDVSVVPASPAPIPLAIQPATGGAVVLSWNDAVFSLQAAAAVIGPYTNVPGAVSPFTNTLAASQLFFRLIAQ